MQLDEFKEKIKTKSQELYISIAEPESKKTIKFSIHNNTTLWRAQTLFSKEPITIDWIKNFSKEKIFYDIGANIGIYSIFASLISQVKTFSFEPESNNYQILMENIILNNLMEYIIPYPIGISDTTELTSLYLSQFGKAQSHHMVKESLNANLEKKETKFKQGIFTTSLNKLITKWDLPIPNYLKIDVDGIEYKIIEKSDFLLEKKELESILIEINSNRKEDKKIIQKLLSYDFTFDKSQVELSTRNSGSHKGYAEYLFYRK